MAGDGGAGEGRDSFQVPWGENIQTTVPTSDCLQPLILSINCYFTCMYVCLRARSSCLFILEHSTEVMDPGHLYPLSFVDKVFSPSAPLFAK